VISSVRPTAAAFALLVGAASLAACNGNNSSTPGGCGAPSGKVALVYPAPNATGIPDNFPGVIFGASVGLGGNYQALLQPTTLPLGNFIGLGTVVTWSQPLPTPYQTPSFSNPLYQISSFAGQNPLSSGTTYEIFLNDSGSNCNPTFQGQFTAQ
jgi:hypothetical protein